MSIGRWVRAVAVLAPTAVAFADLEAAVGNGDVVAGTLSPGTERETLRFRVPKGAVLLAAARGVRRPGSADAPPAVGLTLLDPAGDAIAAVPLGAKGARLKRLLAPATGEYRVVVRGDGRVGDYTASVKWKSRKSFPIAVALDQTARVPFDADAGATAAFQVAAKKGAALPRLLEVRDAADAVIHTFPPSSDATARSAVARGVVLSAGGELTLVVADAGAGGAVAGAVTLRQPPPLARRFAVTTTELPGSGPEANSAFVGPEGGSLSGEGIGPITGSVVDIPAGALATPTAIVIGTSPAIDPGQSGLLVAGPAIYLGPDGLTFEDGLTADVTLPYDPALFPLGTESIRVFTQSAEGAVTDVTPVLVDVATSTVTIPASHFSRFQVFGPPPPPGAPALPLQTSKLAAALGSANDRFAASCAIEGDVVAVGELLGELLTGTLNVGVGHPFRRAITGVWTAETPFVSSAPGVNQLFGESVAVALGVVAVGASQRSTGQAQSGSVFVFSPDGLDWFQQQELRASDVAANAHLGVAVAMSGGTLVAGANGARDAANVAKGGVYVYRDGPNGFAQEAKLVPADAVAAEGAGQTIAIDGDTLAFGTAGFTGGRGAVWVYTRSGTVWTLQQKLEADVPAAGDGFGARAIALSADTIAVAATPKTGTSAVSVFTRSGTTWTREERFDARGVATFGFAVALSKDRLFVGAPGALGPAGADQGLVAVYLRSGGRWSLPATLRPADTAAGQSFGGALAASGEDLVAASIAQGGFAGAAYVFSFSP